jgi:hypothetical protein
MLMARVGAVKVTATKRQIILKWSCGAEEVSRKPGDQDKSCFALAA